MRSRRLTAVLVALVLVATACGKDTDRPDAAAEPAAPTAYQQVLDRVGPDGAVDKDTAVAAFSLAVGELPGASLPDGPRRPVESGSLAVQWILRHWGSLTPEQQKAARAALGTSGGGGGGLTGPLSTAKPNPNLSCPKADSDDAAPHRAAFDRAVGDIAVRLGRTLKLATTVSVNSRDLHMPSYMYTWGCQGTSAMWDPDAPLTGCAVHINPSTLGDTTEHDRRAFFVHEAMHCFLYDKHGMAYSDEAPPWLVEGIPTYAQVSIAGGDKAATEKWQTYLAPNRKPLFQRSYDALGWFAHLSDTGTGVWSRLDPMIDAYFAGGNKAAWSAGNPTATFADSWPSTYARGRHPGKPWDITGHGVPAFQPTLPKLALANGGTATVKTPAAATALSIVDVKAEVVLFTTSGGAHGRFGPSSGADVLVPALAGPNYCAKPGGCVCPEDTPGAGTTFATLAGGKGHLAVTGGLEAATVTATGTSLEKFCRERPKSCLVGDWVGTGFQISMAGGGINASGGAGVTVTIAQDGATTVRFDGMAPVNFTSSAGTAGFFTYRGTAGAKLALPNPEPGSGPWAPATGGFGGVTASATITAPFRMQVLNNTSLAGLFGNGGQAPVSGTPVLGAGRYTCTDTTLTIAPPTASGVSGTWTLSRR